MSLQNRSVVVLAYPGYQELEFWYPVLRAREEGAHVTVVAPSDAECESFLGYPVLGDAEAANIDLASVDAVVVPGTAIGVPKASDGQTRLIANAEAAGRPVFAVGSGGELVATVLGQLDDAHRAADADGLPDLVRRLRTAFDD
jgi:protease I